MDLLLKDKVVVVTGGAKGIGAAIVQTLVGEGAFPVIVDRDLEAGRKLEENLRRHGIPPLLICSELTDAENCQNSIEETVRQFGRLDALVNNASAFLPSPLETATLAQWNELFASNAQAPFFLAQAALPALRATHGAIVNLVDIYAERALAHHPIYVMAKAALAAMTRTLALDLGPDVRVNGVAPGAVMWPSDGSSYTDQEAMLARTPLKRAGRPEDVASAVLWLLRDAPFVTGQIIRVDGGRSVPV